MYRVVYFFLIKETPVNSIVFDFIQICIPKVISGFKGSLHPGCKLRKNIYPDKDPMI